MATEIANPDIENPDIENLTIAIAPGETARITLRVFDPNRNDAVTYRAADSVTPAAVAQAVNTAEADAGVTQPTVAAAITTDAPVPDSGTRELRNAITPVDCCRARGPSKADRAAWPDRQ